MHNGFMSKDQNVYYSRDGGGRGNGYRDDDDRRGFGGRGGDGDRRSYRDRSHDRGTFHDRRGGSDRGGDRDRGNARDNYADRSGYRDRGRYENRGYGDRRDAGDYQDHSPELKRFSKGKGKGKGKQAQDVELTEPTIWVGGCPADISERELVKEFSKCGSVNHVAIKHSNRDTFAFVTFDEIGDAAEAVKRNDQAKLFGGVIKVASANRKNIPPQEQSRRDDYRERGPRSPSRRRGRSKSRSRSPPPRQRDSPDRDHRGKADMRDTDRRRRFRVDLLQLPPDMEGSELVEIASEYGKVLEHDVWKAGRQKSGWLEYGTEREAKTCVQELDDRRMDQWHMRIKATLSNQFGR